jgi:hypothetical protein
MSLSWYLPANLRLHFHLGCPQPRGLWRQQKQEHFECHLPLGEEGETQEINDPERKTSRELQDKKDKEKVKENKDSKTYRRQGMLGVEVTSS